MKLEEDIDRLGCWARKFGMRFQSVKCNVKQIARKWIKKMNASHTLEGTVFDNVGKTKYLGITSSNDLKWNTHVSNICTKANRILDFLRRNLAACPQDVKELKGLMRPVLEYGSSVWDLKAYWYLDDLLNIDNKFFDSMVKHIYP